MFLFQYRKKARLDLALCTSLNSKALNTANQSNSWLLHVVFFIFLHVFLIFYGGFSAFILQWLLCFSLQQTLLFMLVKEGQLISVGILVC